LKALIDYSHALIDCLCDEMNRDKLNQMRIQTEYALQSQEGVYPEWVFEVGFNPGLRGGFRFFLVNLDRIIEIYYSLDALARSGFDAGIMQDMSACLKKSLEKNIELMTILCEMTNDSDYTSDIVDLEKVLRQNIPDNLELLDISTEYVKLTALVRDIKDIREILLQLVLALPAAQVAS
jgi:hypothetical protein